MRLTARISQLLLQPRNAWLRIDEEQASFSQLLWRLVLPLAAIPAVAGFIGLVAVGWRPAAAVQAVRLPWHEVAAVMSAVYLAAVAATLLVSWVTNLVAPTFGGRRNGLAALRLVAYGSSAVWLGGVFLVVPALAALVGVAAIYSVYLIYTGLPLMMRCAPRRRVPYTAVVVLASAVSGLLVSSSATHFIARVMPGLAAATAVPVLEAASLKLDATLDRIEAVSARQAEVAAASASSAAGGVAPVAVPTTGSAPVTGGDPSAGAVPAPALKASLPEKLGPFTRKEIEMQGGRVKGMVTSNARAEYSDGDQRLRVELLDLGSMSKLLAQAGAAVQGEREDSASAERTWQEGGRTMHEKYRKDGSSAQYTTTLRNGVVVELTGQRMTLDEVKAASSQLDLSTLEALHRR